MENQKIKVKIFEISTPIIKDVKGQQRKIIMDFFDFERINFAIMNISRKVLLDRKKTFERKNDNPKTIWLDFYNPCYSEEYAVGKLHTVSHGLESINYDIKELIAKARLGTDEGILGTSLFIIDKHSGYLYLTEDKNYIANKYNVSLYFNSEKKFNKYFIQKFRDENEVVNIEGNKRFVEIGLLKPLPMLEQLKRMKSIKQVDLYPSDTRKNNNSGNGLLYDLKDDVSPYLPNMFEAKVQLNGFSEELTANNLESLIEYLSESEKYEEFKFEAVNEDNVRRVFSSDSMTRDIFIQCDTTVEGWPKEKEFYEELVSKIEDDDQLRVERGVEDQFNKIEASEVLKQIENDEKGEENDKGEKTS